MPGTRQTATDRPSRAARRPLTGVAVALALLLGACSPPGEGAPVTTVFPESPLTTSTADSPELDAGLAELRSALNRYDAGYEYVSEARVGGERAILVEGRRVGDAARQTITVGDGVVEYVTVGGDEWARTPGEAWQVVSGGGAVQDPLDRLASPVAVTMTAAGATRTELEATYPADAFGLEGSDLIIHLVIQDFRLVSADYQTESQGQQATVETTFAALTDSTPITAP